MKQIKLNLIKWLLKLLQPKFTKEQKQLANSVKARTRIYFDGYDYDEGMVEGITTNRLGISNFDFNFTKDTLVVTITLLRPGLLIGKGAQTIDDFTKSLNELSDDYEIVVDIIENRLWSVIR